MAITGFHQPISSYAYQSPFRELDYNSIMALGLGAQQRYDIEEAKRDQYFNEQLTNKIAGGDVNNYRKWVDNVQSGLEEIRSKNPDLTTPEAKASFRDFVTANKMASPVAGYIDTYDKYQNAAKELNDNPQAPDWQTYNTIKKMAVYNMYGTEGLNAIYGSNDFGSISEWKDVTPPDEWMSKYLDMVNEEYLGGMYKGHPAEEMLSLLGLDSNGAVKNVPLEFINTPSGKAFDAQSEYYFDKIVNSNPDLIEQLYDNSGRPNSKYYEELNNYKIDKYGDLAVNIINAKANKELIGSMYSDMSKSIKEQEQLQNLSNNFVTDVLLQDSPTEISSYVAEPLLKLIKNTEKDAFTQYTMPLNKDEKIYASATPTSEYSKLYGNIIDADDKYKKINEYISDVYDTINELEKEAKLTREDPNRSSSITGASSDYTPIILKALNNKLAEYNSFIGKEEIPNVTNLDEAGAVLKDMYTDESKAFTKMVGLVEGISSDEYAELTKDIDRSSQEFDNIMDAVIEEVRKEYKTYTEIGQNLTGVTMDLPIRDDAQYVVKTIDGKKYIETQIKLDKDKLGTLLKGIHESTGAFTNRTNKNIRLLKSDASKWFTASKDGYYYINSKKPMGIITNDNLLKATSRYNNDQNYSREEKQKLVDDYVTAIRNGWLNLQSEK